MCGHYKHIFPHQIDIDTTIHKPCSQCISVLLDEMQRPWPVLLRYLWCCSIPPRESSSPAFQPRSTAKLDQGPCQERESCTDIGRRSQGEGLQTSDFSALSDKPDAIDADAMKGFSRRAMIGFEGLLLCSKVADHRSKMNRLTRIGSNFRTKRDCDKCPVWLSLFAM